MGIFEQLNAKYLRLKQELENDNFEVEQEVLDPESKVQEEYEMTFGKEQKELEALLKKIKSMKKEYDFYDEGTKLDNMFPNRHDDDFDEDSMNFDSVFGRD